jgi:hypothetical protein
VHKIPSSIAQFAHFSLAVENLAISFVGDCTACRFVHELISALIARYNTTNDIQCVLDTILYDWVAICIDESEANTASKTLFAVVDLETVGFVGTCVQGGVNVDDGKVVRTSWALGASSDVLFSAAGVIEGFY